MKGCSKRKVAQSKAAKLEVTQTEATNRITGQFLCAGGGHYVRGEPIRIGGRRFCQRCADAKRNRNSK